jgi:hypothetical protein
VTNKLIINAQIFSGGFEKKRVEFSDIKRKLDRVYNLFHLDKLIIGWCTDKNLYRELFAYLQARGTKMYLWFPVFSELNYFKQFRPVLDFNGQEIKKFELQQGESFEFFCPTDAYNLQLIKDIYRDLFGDIEVEGVFIDKIRYPSFSNGLTGIFTCFCTECQKAMDEYGINLADSINVIRDLFDDTGQLQAETPIIIKNYQNLRYEFEKPIWQEFFDFKSYNIGRSIKDLSEYFRNLGLEVGLDTFAPFLGYFVGQNLTILAESGDFIKPMFYRKTWAPAGLPFETNILQLIFQLDNECGKEWVREIFDFKGKLFPRELVIKEMEELKLAIGNDKILPGFEINKKEGIAPVLPADVKENLVLHKKRGVEGIILSWDIMEAPEENLLAVENFLQDCEL